MIDFTNVLNAVANHFEYIYPDIGTDFMSVAVNEPARQFINVDFDAEVQGICTVSVDDLNIDKLSFTDFVYTDMSAEDLVQEIIDFIAENT